jgi:hypothetical protein
MMLRWTQSARYQVLIEVGVTHMCMNTHPCSCAAWSCHVSLCFLKRLKNESAKTIYKIILKDEMIVIFGIVPPSQRNMSTFRVSEFSSGGS